MKINELRDFRDDFMICKELAVIFTAEVQEQRIGGGIPNSGLGAGAAFEDLKSRISNQSMARWPDNPILFASSTWHLTPDP